MPTTIEEVTCPTCDGSGTITTASGASFICNYCGGRGYLQRITHTK